MRPFLLDEAESVEESEDFVAPRAADLEGHHRPGVWRAQQARGQLVLGVAGQAGVVDARHPLAPFEPGGQARRVLAGLRPQAGEEDLRGFEWRYFWSESQGDQLATLGSHDFL